MGLSSIVLAKVGVGLISGLEKWEQNPEIKKLDKKSTASKCLADFFSEVSFKLYYCYRFRKLQTAPLIV